MAEEVVGVVGVVVGIGVEVEWRKLWLEVGSSGMENVVEATQIVVGGHQLGCMAQRKGLAGAEEGYWV